ncbi:MAG: PfkB family carbohydrate kinase [Planctomycetaceae bacterium]|jgi:rfaE bifunctional protein kinase chain/domain|nr:PfkB family carbohydrate kinase [Planctomycetaceae bacterium]
MMTPQRLGELIGRFAECRIAVIGDFFLDKYLDTEPSLLEHSVETGQAAHQVTGIRTNAGVAGTVVNNLAALGTGQLLAIGAVGNDGEAWELRRCLEQVGCRADHLHAFESLMTPTYLKPRDRTDPSLAGEHERYDTKNRQALTGEISSAVIASLDEVLEAGEVDAVIIADQVEEEDRGVVTGMVREALSRQAVSHPRVVFWVDSRTRIDRFRGVITKPNQFEAVGREFPLPGERVEIGDAMAALGELRNRTGAAVVVTLGERGMLVSDPEPTHVPGVERDGELDTTGAGDSATAGCVLGLASGGTLVEAALVGNLVASITVEQLAMTGTADPEQLRERLGVWAAQQP